MTRSRRRIAIRVCELVALVATGLAVVVLATTGGASKTPQARSASLGRQSHGTARKPARTPTPTPAHRAHATPKAAKTPAPPRPNCGHRGITTHGGKQGTCIDTTGHRITVVNRGSTLHLKEMDVRLAPIRVRLTVGRGVYRTPATNGVFVVVKLTIHNKLPAPALFRPDEVTLLLGPDSYFHDSLAEAAVANSFTNTGGVIRRGHTRTGTVIFDVPTDAAPYLRSDGDVVILQFRDASYDFAFDTIGYFRTYR